MTDQRPRLPWLIGGPLHGRRLPAELGAGAPLLEFLSATPAFTMYDVADPALLSPYGPTIERIIYRRHLFAINLGRASYSFDAALHHELEPGPHADQIVLERILNAAGVPYAIREHTPWATS